MKLKLRSPLTFALLGVVFFFGGCAVSLAPKFNQAIVDNLSGSSTDIFQLFAEVSAGTSKADYNEREDKYNDVIGKVEALALQIKARPIPKNRITDKIIRKANESLTKRAVGPLTVGDIAPSATALKNITDNITKMRDTDKAQGLTPTEVKLFKGNVELFLDQALTYEKFLNK